MTSIAQVPLQQNAAELVTKYWNELRILRLHKDRDHEDFNQKKTKNELHLTKYILLLVINYYEKEITEPMFHKPIYN